MNLFENNNENALTAALVRDLTREAEPIKVIEVADRGIRVARIRSQMEGEKLVDMQPFEHLMRPDKHKGTTLLQDQESFVAYTNLFKAPESVIFFDMDNNMFTTVFDHATKELPAFENYRAQYTLRYSEEFTAWMARNKKVMSQEDFGQFLEERAIDITQPDGAELLEMAMTFEATKAIQFRQATKLRTGSVQVSWVEETRPITADLPATFRLLIPVFRNGDLREIEARLRYRLDNSTQRLVIGFELVRLEEVIKKAVDSVINQVHEGTDLLVLMGKK